MDPSRPARSIFTLEEARALLPTVRRLTAEAVHEAAAVTARLRKASDRDPAREPLAQALQRIVDDWAARVRELGTEVKGLWLVDFDNGDGYYCWRYPEETIAYYHSYTEGFAGRMSIQ
jgi:hypothetical protein